VTGPRDAAPRYAVPVNPETMQELTEKQQARLASIDAAVEVLYGVMHDAEGSAPPGEHQDHTFGSRRMSVARTHIECGIMFAKKAALEAP
jgi:hypothetical protein